MPDASQLEVEAADARMAKAIESGVPQIYANGFAATLTGSDAVIVLERVGQPVAILNLSYTMAKTLALALGRAVSDFERATGQQLLTTHDVDAKFKEAAEKEAKGEPSLN
jgi:hypothetical protein